MNICFILWALIQYYHYFLLFKLRWLWPLRASCLFSMPSSCLLCGTMDTPGSSCVFPAPALEQPLLQEVQVPFIGERYLETKIWVLGATMAARVPFPLGPLPGQR